MYYYFILLTRLIILQDGPFLQQEDSGQLRIRLRECAFVLLSFCGAVGDMILR